MKHTLLTCTALLLALFAGSSFTGDAKSTTKSHDEEGIEGTDAPATSGPEMEWWRDSMKNRDARLVWWREARFGMFVHWGVWAPLGGKFHDQDNGGAYSEHVQRQLRIPIPVYLKEVASTFNPTNFDADAWIRAAKDAGMGYFVITAKHHDGFAMWPSKASPHNIMDATPWKHDPMKDLRAACTKYGVKFGFYYSHAFDWGEKNGVGNDWDYKNPGGNDNIGGREWWLKNPEHLSKVRSYVDSKAIPQVLELVRDYHPDIMWFDTPHKLPPLENVRIFEALREAAPNVVVNGRLIKGMGDYASTCDRPAEFPPQKGDWEGIPTTNESYGWSAIDKSHKPPAHFIRLLTKAVARGGNLLMNVGPMGDGRMDPKDLAILAGIGQWWKVNGESIRGCDRTPLAVQAWGESTLRQGSGQACKGRTLYLHVFDWPTNGTLIVGGLKSEVSGARLLAGGVALKVSRLNAQDVTIALPAQAPDAVDSVIAVDCAGEVATDPARLLQPALGVNCLRGFDAQLRGKGLGYGPGKAKDAYILGFRQPDQAIVWPVRLNEETTYEVAVTGDAANDAGAITVKIGGATLQGTARKGVSQTTVLGRVTLKPGEYEIQLAPTVGAAKEIMRPRELVLTPVQK